jgi:hypothetical protein
MLFVTEQTLRDFLLKCFDRVPERRPSACDLLIHAWFGLAIRDVSLTKVFLISVEFVTSRFERIDKSGQQCEKFQSTSKCGLGSARYDID